MKPLLTVDDNQPVQEAASRMVEKQFGSIIVNKNGKPFGMITETDLVSKIVAPAADASKVLASEVMTAPLITISADSPLTEASRRMVERQVRRLAVTEGGQVAGLIFQNDIVRRLADMEKMAKLGIV